MGGTVKALRGRAISFKADPFQASAGESLIFHDDALIVIEEGKISAFGPYESLHGDLPDGLSPIHYPDSILCAGFVDTHVHFPQMQMIGAYGEQLLEWLEKYTFVAERDFAEKAHADSVAKLFFPRTPAIGNHHGRRLLHGASAIGGCLLRRIEPIQHVHGGGKGPDGPQRTGRPSRYGTARL